MSIERDYGEADVLIERLIEERDELEAQLQARDAAVSGLSAEVDRLDQANADLERGLLRLAAEVDRLRLVLAGQAEPAAVSAVVTSGADSPASFPARALRYGRPVG